MNAPQGYQKIKVHLDFACKHDGCDKARLVAGGHLTPDLSDIGNAYLEATTKEKLYIVAGPEFEELQGHILVIHKALYGLKSSGLRWSQTIHNIMLQLRFKPCKADPCVWLREVKDSRQS